MGKAMRLLLLGLAFAWTSVAHAAGVGQAASPLHPQAVIISQAVSGRSSPTSIMKVNYGPIASSASNGYDLSGATDLIVAQSNTAPTLNVGTYGTGTETQATIINAAYASIVDQLTTYVPQLVAYAKSLNVSRVYYTLDQEVDPQNATQSMRLVWTLSVDDQGHTTYAEPSIYNASPGFVYVSYTPLAVESDLPQSWQYSNAGVMVYQLYSTTGTALSSAVSVNTGGAYDAPQASSSGVDNDAGLECLMDNTSSNTCSTAYPSVRSLISTYSAAFAIVDYLRMVQPVYNTVESPAGSGTYVQEPAVDLSVNLRSWYYASCTALSFRNTGDYGYTLLTDIDRYIAESDGSYAKVFSYDSTGSSPYQDYDYTVGISASQVSGLSSLMIDPSDPSGSLLSASDVPNLVAFAALTEGASQAASPYTLNSTGSYGSSAANSDHDHILEFSGAPTTSYADSTTYTGTNTFTISDVSEITQALFVYQNSSNFVSSIKVNGTIIYSSAGSGNVYKCAPVQYQNDRGVSETSAWSWPGVSPTQGSGYDSFCSDSNTFTTSPMYTGGYGGYGTYFDSGTLMEDNYGAMTGNIGTVNMDIRPYLVNGTNTVSFNGVIGGYGYSGSGSWDIRFEIWDACGG